MTFNINLTPFSAYVTIHSSFNKNSIASTISKAVPDKALNDNFNDQKNQFVKHIEELNAAKKASCDNIRILEEKISKVEATSYKDFYERN